VGAVITASALRQRGVQQALDLVPNGARCIVALTATRLVCKAIGGIAGHQLRYRRDSRYSLRRNP
jgi:hypothetical protein